MMDAHSPTTGIGCSKMNVDEEIFEGYRDGFRDTRETAPESLGNHSEAYIFGWLNGRDDRLKHPRQSADALRSHAAALKRFAA